MVHYVRSDLYHSKAVHISQLTTQFTSRHDIISPAFPYIHILHRLNTQQPSLNDPKQLQTNPNNFIISPRKGEPQTYMFGQMRDALGITKSIDILDHIYTLPSDEQESAMEKIRNIERNAMASQKAQPGLIELMTYLQENSVRKGICTRNFE